MSTSSVDPALDVDAAAEETADALRAAGLSLAAVESCTGGWVAQVMTSIAGSSAFFDRGWVTYTNEAKMQCVAVPEATLVANGAVSEQTAEAMARGGLALSDAGICVSITGIAGPTGATPGKPVGTVCFGWATSSGVRAERCQFDGDRRAVRAASVVHALRGVAGIVRGG